MLKPTGSLYLHCDPTASHYLKVLLDTIFGKDHFLGEITWKRTSSHSDAKRWSPVADTILYYAKGKAPTWNPQHADYSEHHLGSKYRNLDSDGRRFMLDNMTSPNPRPNMMYEWKGHKSPPMGWRYSRETMQRLDSEGRIWYPDSTDKRPRLKRFLDEMPGAIVTNIWTDIDPVNARAAERLGYPTQKPLALLERIIAASSNPGDVVLDPFCGCGTAVVAAEKLGRQWIGIDVTHLAITLMKERLRDSFPGIDFTVRGEPADLGSARLLAESDRYQFQWWALSLVRAKPVEGREKKGADKGIDGVIVFADDHTGNLKRCLVQVKSGKVTSAAVRDLRGTLEREGAELGLFVTLDSPSADMKREAAVAGMYLSEGWQRDYPRIQIATIADLLTGTMPAIPYGVLTFAKAPWVGVDTGERQGTLELPGASVPVSPRRSL